MKLVLALVVTFFAAGAVQADTANMRKSKSTLVFRDASASASGGATRPAPDPSRDPEKDTAFRKLDIDGDGFVSKAEAAGNAFATLGFDRADRNKDGKLSFAEYDSIGKKAQKKAQAKARTGGSASAGPTKKSGENR